MTAPGLAFIHIPKTGGTSVVRAIAEAALPIRVSQHPYPEALGDEEITVLRDPFARFVSAFRYGKTRWPNPVNARFASAAMLAEAAADPEHEAHAWAWRELGNRPEDFLARDGQATPCQTVLGRPTRLCWVYEPQSTWLANAPRHLLRQERLDEDFNALLRARGLAPVTLPRLNGSDRIGTDVLEGTAAGFVRALYADDIRRHAQLHGASA